MKKFVIKTCRVLAKITYSAASAGAGMASANGWHQPKVPERLSK